MRTLYDLMAGGRPTLRSLALGCVLLASVGCTVETGKPTLPDMDKVPPPSGGRMVADPSKLESVPIKAD